MSERAGMGLGDDAQGDLARRVEALESRIQALQEDREMLIRKLGHELRNPLGVILTQAELIRRGPGWLEQVPRAQSIAENCRRMARMLGEMSEVARLESGRGELRPRVVDLRTFLEDAQGRLADNLELGRVLFESAAPPPLAFVDPEYLERLVSRLLENALDASPPGAPVRVELHSRGGRPAVSVSDSGPSISPDDRDRAFGRFYHRRGAKQTGLGMVLHIADLIANALGGELTLSSGAGGPNVLTALLAPAPPAR